MMKSNLDEVVNKHAQNVDQLFLRDLRLLDFRFHFVYKQILAKKKENQQRKADFQPLSSVTDCDTGPNKMFTFRYFKDLRGTRRRQLVSPFLLPRIPETKVSLLINNLIHSCFPHWFSSYYDIIINFLPLYFTVSLRTAIRNTSIWREAREENSPVNWTSLIRISFNISSTPASPNPR